jgi:cytosine/adenosine deaminase-related metal-dependent hydrolase
MLVAHVNDADDAAIETLAATRTSVAYCPHASTYFGAARHFGPHRYRDMLAAGIPVALGTDSIVNLPQGSANPPALETHLDDASGISILREMRYLFARDMTDPVDLLRMATVNGARALGLTDAAFTFRPDASLAGLLSIELPDRVAGNPPRSAAESVLRSPANPEILFADNYSGLVGTIGVALT